MLNFALRYLGMGFSVIPVKSMSKEPLISWKEFQNRRASESEIREWYKKWPDANIGIVTGLISQAAIVDCDGPEGLKEAQRILLHSPVITLTGNGRQLWYRHPGGTIQNSVRSYPGVDVRGDGGFVVAPPSIHPNGKRYRWLRPVLSVNDLPAFPIEIFAGNVPKESQTQDANRNAPGWISQALEEMKYGNIDDTLFKICSRLRNDGYTAADVESLLRPHAERVGADEGHLRSKIDNVWGRYPAGANPTDSVRGVQQNGGSTELVLHTPSDPNSVLEYNHRQQIEFNVHSVTGYSKFDALTKGLRPGNILTVAAETGVGKSNWSLVPIKTFCEKGKKVVLFSTEMSFDETWGRYKAIISGTGLCFEEHKLFVCDEFTPNPQRIEEALRQVKPDLFIFDQINHITTDQHELANFMRELKRLARLFNIPGIVLAQIRRGSGWNMAGERIPLRLDMIKGSGVIAEMSSQVLLLAETRLNSEGSEIEGTVDKNRYGSKGLVHFRLRSTPSYKMEEV